jgi:indole-3-glycerol phosphate synthase
VAESGLAPETIPSVSSKFDAALVGTSLLRDPRGIAACLADFDRAIEAPPAFHGN